MNLIRPLPSPRMRLDLDHPLCNMLSGLWFHNARFEVRNQVGGQPARTEASSAADYPALTPANGAMRLLHSATVGRGMTCGNPAALGMLGSFTLLLRANSISSPGFGNQYVLANNDDFGTNRGFDFTAVDTFVTGDGPTLYVSVNGSTDITDPGHFLSMSSTAFWGSEAVLGCSYNHLTGAAKIYYDGAVVASATLVTGGNLFNSGAYRSPRNLNGHAYWSACFREVIPDDQVRAWSEQSWPMFRPRPSVKAVVSITLGNQDDATDGFYSAGPGYFGSTSEASVDAVGIGPLGPGGLATLGTQDQAVDGFVGGVPTLSFLGNQDVSYDGLVAGAPAILGTQDQAVDFFTGIPNGDARIIAQNVYRR